MGDMVMEKIGKKLAGEIAAALLVMGVAVCSVWPMVQNPSRVADYGKDGELIIWIINQNVRKLFPQNSDNVRVSERQRLGVFDGNIFYPYKNVLTYSDMFWPTSILTAIPFLVTKNPATAFGWAMIIGQVATMLIIYGWWREMTGNKWAAAVSAIALGLAQFRWHYQVHLQMWGMQWWLLGLWLCWRWLKNGKGWQLFMGAVLIGLQAWESVLPVYFAGAVLLVLSVFHLTPGPSPYFRGGGLKIAGAVVLAGMIALMPILAYWGVSRDFDYQRSIRDAAHNGVSVDEIYPWFGSWGFGVLLIVALLKLSPSFIPPLKVRGGNGGVMKDVWWLVGVMILGLVMALGPTLKWGGKTVKIAGRFAVPLPYAAIYYTVPGFGALRTPSRWIWLFGWAGSGLIAMGFYNTLLRPPLASRGGFLGGDIKRVIVVGGAIAVAVAGGVHLTKFRDIPVPKDFPAVTGWLAQQEGQVVAYLPMGDENTETERMLYSLVDGKVLVNGFSGFMPPERQKLVEKLKGDKWEAGGIEELKKLGTDWVVVDKEKAQNYKTMLEKEGLREVYSDERWEVYKW
jgi:MFS family permease